MAFGKKKTAKKHSKADLFGDIKDIFFVILAIIGLLIFAFIAWKVYQGVRGKPAQIMQAPAAAPG